MISHKSLVYISFLIIGMTSPVLSQSDNFPTGSRAASMGNAYVGESDVWSTHHNQAGLGFFPHFAIGFHHENKFLVEEYPMHAMALTLPVKPGTFGFSYTYFGNKLYNESKLGLGFGKQFGSRLAAGVQLNYHHNYIMGEYERRDALSVEGGIQYKPDEKLTIGVQLSNPTRAIISPFEQDTIPTYFNIGFDLKPFDKFILAIQLKKKLDHELRLLGGMEYELLENLYIRTGIMTNPVQSTFGLGYKLGKLSADIAFTHHQILGFTPHFSFQAIIR
ncbi:MAG: hypothetical protein K9H49_13215 [Bacteroidales bacterium]|nr:hypothetical protein [Bacteroidales bacterium]MCF8390218.1 hypothetical protein [Bacteroidales bacterium]